MRQSAPPRYFQQSLSSQAKNKGTTKELPEKENTYFE
jgi:hypothetical protein